MAKVSKRIAFFLLLLPIVEVHAQNDLRWEIIEDKESAYLPDSVIKREADRISDYQTYNFGYTTSTFWLKTTVTAFDAEYLIIDNSLVRYLDFYLVKDGVVETVEKTEYLRDRRTGKIAFQTPHIRIPDNFVDGQLLVRVQGTDLLLIPFRWMSEEAATRFLENSKAPAFLMAGAIFALIILYTIFFISLNSRIYLYYLAYAITVVFTVLKLNGLFFSRIPSLDFLYDYTAMFQTLPTIAAGVFTVVFLRLHVYYPRAQKIIMVLVYLQVASILVTLAGFNHISYMLTDAVAFMFIPVAFSVSWATWTKKNYRPAKYYLISWLFVFVGAFLYWLRSYFSVGVESLVFKHGIELGITFEMAFLAYGLSKIVENIRKDKEKLQADNIRLLKDANRELEEKVEERTSEIMTKNNELTAKNNELHSALDRLKTTQRQLVRSEKMASLGVLSSGLSHEINNPLNYIRHGAEVLRKEMKSRDLDPEAENAFKAVDEGVNRILSIVRSLSQFSRQTDTMNEDCNIETILENCLTILQNRLREKVAVRKDYGLEGILFKGNEGKLHQAIVNILSNALDAMEDVGNPLLSVRTYTLGNLICLSIADNGSGIEAQDLPHVADPFYTTKSPGRGTGLGLSITYSIISEHEGDVEVNSTVSTGTTVSIYLPVRPKGAPKMEELVSQ